jgi:5'-nucleotidase
MQKALLLGGYLGLLLPAGAIQATEYDAFFDWAETNYPQLFAPADAKTEQLAGYIGRCYDDTNTCIGVMGGQVDVYGEQFGGLQTVGSLDELLPQDPAYTLSIVHINDHHSHLEADDIEFDIDGVETKFPLGGFPRVVTKIEELVSSAENVLKLHAGDAITGTLFYTLFRGEADAEMMNQVCFDAFALGNHEFDSGDAGLVEFLDFLKRGSCNTPVLGANVVPEVGVSPLTPTSPTDYIQPYTIADVNGERIGIIGIVIAQKTKVSSNPDETTEFLDETETAQRYIDELTAQGVDKIVLLTHYQYANDLAMAPNLRGVDVIVGGDSHSLLGSYYEDMALSPEGSYPTIVANAGGEPTCVVQAWQYSAVVGELHVDFDEQGRVVRCDGTPHMLLGDDITQEDEAGDDMPVTPEVMARIMALDAAIPEASIVTPDANASALLDDYSAQVDLLEQQVIGSATEDLCLERVPGQGRSSIPGCTELTAQNGGHIQQLVAKAYREQVNATDIAIQNAGGVRIDIPEGDITIATVYELLPFSNTMVQLTMTGAEIAQVLEEGVSNFVDEGGSTGAYPYAAGLRWDIDLTQPAGSRFSNLEVSPLGSSEWQPLDLSATYVVTTNSFAASGGDGYATFKTVSDDGRAVDTFLEYAQTFTDWLQSIGGVLSRPALDEYSTQGFIPEE